MPSRLPTRGTQRDVAIRHQPTRIVCASGAVNPALVGSDGKSDVIRISSAKLDFYSGTQKPTHTRALYASSCLPGCVHDPPHKAEEHRRDRFADSTHCCKLQEGATTKGHRIRPACWPQLGYRPPPKKAWATQRVPMARIRDRSERRAGRDTTARKEIPIWLV